eukprot:GHVS01011572.1.p1 GENE.GHVS01011572.1~~GHVS01011572.1.p1  ORF type:complete len:454 (+),score=54.48 GHVS01011572.1:93-1364(+)
MATCLPVFVFILFSFFASTSIGAPSKQFTTTSLCLAYPPPFTRDSIQRCSEQIPSATRPIGVEEAHGGVSFLTMGDWGLPGSRQAQVAHWMSVAAAKLSVRYVLALGDNFYPHGVKSSDAPDWQVLTDLFGQKSLQQIPFYAILGNHDYHTNPYSQIARHYLHSSQRWYMPNYWYYTVHKYTNVPAEIEGGQSVRLREGGSKLVRSGLGRRTSRIPAVTVEEGPKGYKMTVVTVFVDTVLLARRPVTNFGLPYDELYSKQMEFIKSALAAGSAVADWLFVVGHHELYSSGAHGDVESLKKVLVPLFAEYKVDAYFNGHDHHMELLYDGTSGTHFYVSGSASKRRRVKCQHELCKFASEEYGFTSHVLSRDKMYSSFISNKGDVIKTYTQNRRTGKRCPNIIPSFPPVELVSTGHRDSGILNLF